MAADPSTVIAATDMVRIEGRTYAMGSERFYPEERPVQPATVETFWIDRHLVTNGSSPLSSPSTGYVTVAERPIEPARLPRRPPRAARAGRAGVQPAAGTDPARRLHPVVAVRARLQLAHPVRARNARPAGTDHPVVQVAFEDVEAYARVAGRAAAHRGGVGARRTRRAGRRRVLLGRRAYPDGAAGQQLAGHVPLGEHRRTTGTWAPRRSARSHPTATASRHGRQRLGVDHRLVAGRHAGGTHACCGPTVDRSGDREASIAPGEERPRRVIKGGSHLCAPNYCSGSGPAARQPEEVETARATSASAASPARILQPPDDRQLMTATTPTPPLPPHGQAAAALRPHHRRGSRATTGPGSRSDAVAGATIWGLLIPEMIAYAGLAGLPPQAGLYTLLASLGLYAIFGTSRHLVVAGTSASAILVFSTVAALEPATPTVPALAAAAVVTAGVLFVVAGLFKLGFITAFLSQPVMDGLRLRPGHLRDRQPAAQAVRDREGRRRLHPAARPH